MVPTKEWVEETFNHFNDEIFGGSLVPPRFEILRSSKYCGMCKKDSSGFIIGISGVYNRSERDCEDILLHEMCHLIFYQSGNTKERHGRYFQMLVDSINSQYSRNIAYNYYDGSDSEIPEEFKKYVHVYIILKDGHIGYGTARSRNDILIKNGFNNLGAETIGYCYSNDDHFQNRHTTITPKRFNGKIILHDEWFSNLWKNSINNEIWDSRLNQYIYA